MIIMAGVEWAVPSFGTVPFGMNEVQQDIIGTSVNRDSAFLGVFNVCLSSATSASLRVI